MTSVVVQDPAYRRVLERTFPDVRFFDLADRAEPIADDRVALIIGRPMPKSDTWMRVASAAEYVHFTSTGYDELSPQWLIGRTLTTAKGTNAVPVAEFAVACVLARAKNIPAVWEPGYRVYDRPLGTLEGAKIAVLGYGTVGERIVRMLSPFTDDIAVYRRRVSDAAPAGVTFTDDVDTALRDATHIVLALELTDETAHVLSASRIASLTAGAHIVNVGRAGLIDQAALERAAAAGNIVASLDVTDPEPLPADASLRDTPGTLISPHVAWSGPQVMDNRIALVIENIRGWLEGTTLSNVVLAPKHATQ